MAFLSHVPERSGVYFMLSQENTILYIGKAKCLRNRIRSYFQMKPGQSPEHILQMIENVSQIQWQECRTEGVALSREQELLHAIRPPYNIAGTEADHYLFVGIRENPRGKKPQLSSVLDGNELVRLDFQLSSHDSIQNEGYQVYGCFKHRTKIKRGYTALLRLIHAATYQGGRFSCPARLCRTYPPWQYSIGLPNSWKLPLDRFLNGINIEILHLMFNRLLENEWIPGFVRASIQDDIELARLFFVLGPKGTRKIKRSHGIKHPVITQSQMDELIASTTTLTQS